MHRSNYAFLLVALAACGSTPKRNPIPEHLADEARISNFEDIRYWSTETPPTYKEFMTMSDAELEAIAEYIMDREHNYLAVSGGGQNGAFGAGLLCGWTEEGSRPEFISVTGISTGSLIAPFAFLGPEYDWVIEEFYTTYSTKDLLKKRGKLAILGSDAAMSTAPLAEKIAEYFSEEIMEAIATEWRKGRRLLIGTTNLDAERGVIWDIGRIANYGGPEALELIHQVVLASCSIPVGFPPVLIEVEAGGATYDEIHVDGGVSRQVFWYPGEVKWPDVERRLRVQGDPNLYIIRNAHIEPVYHTTDDAIFQVAGRSADSLIRTQGIGDLYKMFLYTQRDGINFNLASIPADFDKESKEPFDPEYMRALFALGKQMALDGYPWVDGPRDV